MPETDPWAPFAPQQPTTSPPASPFGNRPVIYQGRDPDKAEDQQFQRDAAARDAAKFEYQQQRDAVQDAKDAAKGNKPATNDVKLQQKRASLTSLETQINRVQQLYDSNLKDEAYGVLSSIGQMLPTQDNRQFNAAAAGMAEQGMSAFRVPGVGAQSDTELRQFVEANRPAASNYDTTIEEKLRQLRVRVEATRAEMGLPPAQWAKPPPLGGDEAQAGLQERIAASKTPADAAAIIQWLVANNRPPDADTIARIMANVGNPNPDVRPPEEPGLLRSFGEGVGGVVEGAGDVLGIVSNPFSAAINAATGSNLSTDMGRSLREATGLPDASNSGQQVINALGAGALMGGGFAGIGRAAAPYVSGAIQGGLRTLGAAPGSDMVAGGASMGSSEIARQAGAGPVGQLAAGLVGGGMSLPLAARMARTGNPVIPNALARAGEAEGVTVNRAMVDPSMQPKATAVGKTYVGSKIMHNRMRKIGGQIEDRARSLGQGGQPLQEPAAVGNLVQNIGKRYIKASGAEFKQKYGALRKETADVDIPPAESVPHVDAILARLNKAPNQNAKEIQYLEGIKADISNGVDVETARDIGSRLSRDISKGDVTFGKSEADVLDIRKALVRDTENGLEAAGKPAAAASYKEVDAAYSQRMSFIKQKLQNLLGKRNAPLDPEKAAGRLKTMAGERGDATGLNQLLKKATPEEREDIAATFAHSLGRNKDGAFSTAKFVSDLAATPPAARVAVFGKDGAQSLANLRALAAEHKRVQGALGGSPTALATDWRGYLYNIVLGPVAGLVTGHVGTAAAAATAGVTVKVGRDVISARLLMSPKITNWLRSAPRTDDPRAINAHFGRLKAIAVREPALAADIGRLQDVIMRAANENAMPRAAASGGQETERR